MIFRKPKRKGKVSKRKIYSTIMSLIFLAVVLMVFAPEILYGEEVTFYCKYDSGNKNDSGCNDTDCHNTVFASCFRKNVEIREGSRVEVFEGPSCGKKFSKNEDYDLKDCLEIAIRDKDCSRIKIEDNGEWIEVRMRCRKA